MLPPQVEQALLDGLSRAQTLCGVEEYLSNTHAGVLEYSDILRSAVVLSVSCFDHFMHGVVREICVHRVQNSKAVSRLQVPADLLLRDVSSLEPLLRKHLDDTNAYKSFVAPDKVAEALSSFVANPWQKISAHLSLDEKATKARLREIVDWRNRIAHEADVNPNLGGIELWPINRSDVLSAITDLRNVAITIKAVVEAEP